MPLDQEWSPPAGNRSWNPEVRPADYRSHEDSCWTLLHLGNEPKASHLIWYVVVKALKTLDIYQRILGVRGKNITMGSWISWNHLLDHHFDRDSSVLNGVYHFPVYPSMFWWQPRKKPSSLRIIIIMTISVIFLATIVFIITKSVTIILMTSHPYYTTITLFKTDNNNIAISKKKKSIIMTVMININISNARLMIIMFLDHHHWLIPTCW